MYGLLYGLWEIDRRFFVFYLFVSQYEALLSLSEAKAVA